MGDDHHPRRAPLPRVLPDLRGGLRAAARARAAVPVPEPGHPGGQTALAPGVRRRTGGHGLRRAAARVGRRPRRGSGPAAVVGRLPGRGHRGDRALAPPPGRLGLLPGAAPGAPSVAGCRRPGRRRGAAGPALTAGAPGLAVPVLPCDRLLRARLCREPGLHRGVSRRGGAGHVLRAPDCGQQPARVAAAGLRDRPTDRPYRPAPDEPGLSPHADRELRRVDRALRVAVRGRGQRQQGRGDARGP